MGESQSPLRSYFLKFRKPHSIIIPHADIGSILRQENKENKQLQFLIGKIQLKRLCPPSGCLETAVLVLMSI